MLFFAALYASAIAVGTLVLATSLFLIEETKDSSFKRYGARSTLARCAGICIGATLGPFLVLAEDPAPTKDGSISNIPGVTPFWILLALAVWFGGVVFLLRRTPWQALLLFPVNALFGLGVAGAIRFVLLRVLMKENAA